MSGPRTCRLVVVLLITLACRTLSAQPAVQYVYDALGRLIAVVDATGDTATYTYDAVGNVLAISRHGSSTVSIITFGPGSGPVGTTVTIQGTGYSVTPAQDTVTFNGTAATVTSATTTQLVVTVPSGATTGTIGVTSPGGSATSGSAFTVGTGTGTPTITSFTPTIGTTNTSVTVSGTNFQTTAANDLLLFNTLGGTHITSATTTSLGAAVPPVAASGHLTVATPTGTAISSGDFFVPPTPYVAGDVASTGRVALGSAIAVPVTTANQIGLVVFDGTAGHRVSLLMVPGPLSTVTLYKPNGALLATGGVGLATALIDPQTLTTTGTYSISVVPSGTGTTTLTPYDVPADLTGPITPAGATVSATLATPGQNAHYTLATPTNPRVSLTIGGGGPTGTVSVANADGSLVTSGGMNIGSTFVEPWAFGTGQTITVDPLGPATGTVTLTAFDVPADLSGTVTPGGAAVTAALTSPGQNALYTVGTPTTGRVSLTYSAGVYGTLSLRDPAGTPLISVNPWTAGFIEPWTFASGQTILVDPFADNTGSTTLTAYNMPPDTTGTVTIGGGVVAVPIATPGQNGTLTFSGTAAQPVLVQVSGNTFGWVTVTLLSTDGTTVLSQLQYYPAGFNLAAVTLPANGTYTIQIDPYGAEVGTLNISVAVPMTPVVLVNGTAAPTVVTVPHGTNVTVFVGGPGSSTDWLVLAPAGSSEGTYLSWQYLNGSQTPPSPGLTSATLTVTMPATPGDYEFRFYASNSWTRLATSTTVTAQ
jgi:YD repeat-containing protein